MTIQEALHLYLTDVDDLVALVPSSSISWIDARQTKTYPRVTYKQISAPPLYDAPDQWQRWRFYAYHMDKSRCLDIATALHDCLHRFSGDMAGIYISYISLIDRFDPEYQETQQVYEAALDFRICFTGGQ